MINTLVPVVDPGEGPGEPTPPPLSKGLDDTSLPLPLTQDLDLAMGNVTINFI